MSNIFIEIHLIIQICCSMFKLHAVARERERERERERKKERERERIRKGLLTEK